jgi:hypothetical protein
MGILCEELYGQCRPFMAVEDVIVDQAHRRRGIGRDRHVPVPGCQIAW